MKTVFAGTTHFKLHILVTVHGIQGFEKWPLEGTLQNAVAKYLRSSFSKIAQ